MLPTCRKCLALVGFQSFLPLIFALNILTQPDHTKMMVLLRYDDQAQVVIHTANMISQDWTNLSQAIWKSPLLPVLTSSQTEGIEPSQSSQFPPFGSGERFKFDFLNYLRAYNKQRTICKSLIAQLSRYDFSAVRGALIGSVPGRHHIETDNGTLWGWPALQQVLKSVCPQKAAEGSEVVAQISSIATLGQTDAWIQKTFLKALGSSKQGESTNLKLGIVFPTADEIRRSLDGYQSGCSVHM
jgi:tyrosyl-DNA phosphodiesterase-1